MPSIGAERIGWVMPRSDVSGVLRGILFSLWTALVAELTFLQK
jgi:hypothetical protein